MDHPPPPPPPPTTDFVGTQHSTHTTNSGTLTITYDKVLHARVQLSLVDYLSFQFSTGQIIQQEIISHYCAQQTRWCKDNSKFVLQVEFSREPRISQALLNGRAIMKTRFRAVSSHTVLIACRAVIFTRNIPNKGLPGKNKISSFSK